MAGLWDRIGTRDSLPVHLITSAILLASDNEFTNTKVLAALNKQTKTPLDSNTISDLLGLQQHYLSLANDGQKALFLHKLESILIAKEVGEFDNEVKFRNYLGI